MTPLLLNLTGFFALSLNIFGLVRQSDRTLRYSTGWASAIWAVNNLLMGAQSAAALSVLSVGRQASAQAVQGRGERMRLWACCAFLALTVVIGIVTWQGPITLCTTTGSMLATYAMFHLRGAWLRVAMIAVAALWMVHALAYDSWWQMFANALSGGAAALGAWRARQAELAR